jgi:hypothetical protein
MFARSSFLLWIFSELSESSLLSLSRSSSSSRDILPCAPPLPPNGGSSTDVVSLNNTGGLNYISLYACSSSQPSNATCSPGSSDANVLPCGLLLSPNATSYVNITLSSGKLTAVTIQWHSSNPFSYHAIKSTPALTILWPPPGNRGFVIVPYPSSDSILCDVDDDCPRGVKCNTLSPQPQCASFIPSPLPSPPPPVPVPSPSPGPRASTCNLTSPDWVQSNLGISSRHEGDAFITMIMSSTVSGEFSFLCKASKGKCPFNTALLNGTGQLSSHDDTFSLVPSFPSGLPTITGYINSTFTCSALTLVGGLTAPLSWTFYGSSQQPHNFNLDVALSTFLGSGSKNFVATGVAILQSQPSSSSSVIALAGNGQAEFSGLSPKLLLGASPSSNGTIVLISADALSSTGSKPKVIAYYKVGERIDHIRSNAQGDVAVAGSFGIAKIGGLLSTAKIEWNDLLTNTQPGTCGICCSYNGNTNTTCRVDIGEDGVVAASYASFAIDNSGWLWGAYSLDGTRFFQKTAEAATLTDVFVNSKEKLFGATYFYNSNTGKEPMVMPRIVSYSYSTVDPDLAWELFPWSASVYRSPGPCDGNVADGRILAIRVARDGSLLLGGRSDGGDSPWFCGTRNSTRTVPFVSFDQWTSGYNMGAQAIANIIRADPVTGESIEGQIILTRLPEAPFKGNTLITAALQSDNQGNLYLLQNSACCIPNMLNLTVNNNTLGGYGDGATLQILSSDFKTRRHWTHFTSAASKSGGSSPIDIDIREETVAAVMQSNAEMVEINALPGTTDNVGGAPTAYFVLLSTSV